MARTAYTSRQRLAFTLMELLVVIAIIAILGALLLAGVMVWLSTPAEVQARSDISQLAAALGNFKKKYNVFPPDRIRLFSSAAEYTAAIAGGDKFAEFSITSLNRIWPNLGNFSGVAWNGVAPYTAGTYEDLGPHQAYVFFLGGIPDMSSGVPNFLGFSNNPKDPASPAIKDRNFRVGPFFEFKSARLYQAGTNIAGSPMFSFKDAFNQQPYAYFCSNLRRNGYSNAAVTIGGFTFAPYFESASKFHNPDTFQILCAGRDGKFGPGGLWQQQSAKAWGVANPDGRDDMTNLNGDKLMGIN